MTTIERRTTETQVTVRLVPADEEATIDTSVPFLDHMLRTLARYSGLPLAIAARGDLRHHIIEDVAISVGELLAARDLVGTARYGDRTVPMDDALVHCALDIGGRFYYKGRLPSTLYDHWMRSFAEHARCTLHLRVLRGTDRHHVVEAGFKALGFCLRDALAMPALSASEVSGDARVFSTKGRVALRKT